VLRRPCSLSRTPLVKHPLSLSLPCSLTLSAHNSLSLSLSRSLCLARALSLSRRPPYHSRHAWHRRYLVYSAKVNLDEARYTKGLREIGEADAKPAAEHKPDNPRAHKFDRVALFGAGVLGKAMINRLVKSRPSDGQCYVGEKGCNIYDISKSRVDRITKLSSKCVAAETVISLSLYTPPLPPQHTHTHT